MSLSQVAIKIANTCLSPGTDSCYHLETHVKDFFAADLECNIKYNGRLVGGLSKITREDLDKGLSRKPRKDTYP